MAETLSVLMVTREGAGDRRYGLGKSLAPLLAELERRGIAVAYLSQADLGVRSVEAMRSFHRLLLWLLGRGLLDPDSAALAYGIAERINMGRLSAKIAARDDHTHVHCHDPVIAWGFRFFSRLRRNSGPRWGVTEHGYGSYMQAFHEDGALLSTGRMRLLRRMEAGILRRADWVLTPTKACRAQLARDLSVHPIPRHWRVVPHSRPILRRYDRREARDRLGWEGEALYAIAVGRLAPLKQFPALVEACAKLADPRLQLVIIGEGDRAPLQQLADDLGIGSRIQFAVTDDIGLYYSAADIYVSTSITESFGLANLEAITAGVPSICTAVGGVPDVVGTGAYLIPAADRGSLIRAMKALVSDPGERARLARRGLERGTSWPKATEVAELYLSAYKGSQEPALEIPPVPSVRPGNVWSGLIEHFDLCPLPRRLMLPRDLSVLVIAPHPDDEVLACGGTLALLRQRNCRVHVVVVTDGARGDPLNYSEEDVAIRRAEESRSALRRLGIEDVHFLGYPDGDFRDADGVQAKLLELLDGLDPDWLLLPSPLDYHRDHVGIALAVLRAWQSGANRARAFMWELWQPLPATWVVDIGDVFELRQQAAACYRLPHLYCNYSAASAHLVGFRGLYLDGFGQAEAFMEVDAADPWPIVDQLMSLRAYQERLLISPAPTISSQEFTAPPDPSPPVPAF